MMLLAPKTLWAMVNLAGSVGGKYGANTHFSAHLRLKILQAAQGLITTGGGGGEDDEEGEWESGVEEVVDVFVSLHSILASSSFFSFLFFFVCLRERER